MPNRKHLFPEFTAEPGQVCGHDSQLVEGRDRVSEGCDALSSDCADRLFCDWERQTAGSARCRLIPGNLLDAGRS